MGVTSSNKQIDINRIDCDGSLKVTLALSAAPDILSNPIAHNIDTDYKCCDSVITVL